MIALFFSLVLFSAVAAGVVAYAAYTHRGLPLPGSPVLNERVDRWQENASFRVGGPLENTAVTGALISHGVMMTPQKDIEARHWFVRAERRIMNRLPASAQRRLGAHIPSLAPATPAPSNSGDTALV